MHKLISQNVDVLISLGNQALVTEDTLLQYCGLKMTFRSSPEGERSAVDSFDWLLIESACVIEAGEVCNSSSG
jgi:hypothetical protein